MNRELSMIGLLIWSTSS